MTASQRRAAGVLSALGTSMLALTLAVASVAAPGASAGAGIDPRALALAEQANCQLLASHATSSAQRTWARTCATNQGAIASLLASPPTPTASPTATATPTVSPTVGPTTAPPTPTPTPTVTAPPSAFPTPGDTAAGTTGWRHTGVTLTLRTGLLRVTTPNAVIDSIEARDGIEVQADGVIIRRSLVEGANTGPGAGIWIDAGVTGTVISDVEVTSRPGADPTVESAIVDRAITAFQTRGTVMQRVYVHRTIRGLQFGCDTAILDSWVDGEVNPGLAHMSGVGGETCDDGMPFNLLVAHNHVGLSPNPEDSAALLYYPPQRTPHGDQVASITIRDNYITGGTYCLWVSSDPQLSGQLTVTGNVFGSDYYPTCGRFGLDFTDNLPHEAGPAPLTMAVTWSGNTHASQAVPGP